MEREVGGGIGIGNTCKPMAVSFQCMTKSTTNLKEKKKKDRHSRDFLKIRLNCGSRKVVGVVSCLHEDSQQSARFCIKPSR